MPTTRWMDHKTLDLGSAIEILTRPINDGVETDGVYEKNWIIQKNSGIKKITINEKEVQLYHR